MEHHKTLDESQIENLFAFVKSHYVEYYDIQLELVDHLANDIEHMLSEDDQLDFESAKTKAFKKFGIYGFSDIVTKKENAVTYEFFKEAFYQTFMHFKNPLIYIFLLFFFIVSKYIPFIYWAIGYNLLLFIGIAVLDFLIKKREKKTNKIYLRDHIVTTQGISICSTLIIIVHSFFLNGPFELFSWLGEYRHYLYSFIAAFLLFFMWVSCIQLPRTFRLSSYRLKQD